VWDPASMFYGKLQDYGRLKHALHQTTLVLWPLNQIRNTVDIFLTLIIKYFSVWTAQVIQFVSMCPALIVAVCRITGTAALT